MKNHAHCIAITALFVLAFPMLIRSAVACSVCGCGDPLMMADDPSGMNGRFRPQIDTEFLTVKAGSEDDPALTDNLDQYTVRFTTVYRPTSNLNLVGTVPYARKNLSTEGDAISELSGIGDVEIGGRYTVLDRVSLPARRRTSFAITAGSSLPTGSNNATRDRERVDEHGQIGTGSWGPYAGLHFRIDFDRWAAHAGISARTRSTNSHDYRYGKALLWSFHAQYRAISRVALDAGVDGRYAVADQDGGEEVENTGGTVFAAAPGLYWNAVGPLSLAVRAQFPVYTRLLGVQKIGPTVNIGIQWLVQ